MLALAGLVLLSGCWNRLGLMEERWCSFFCGFDEPWATGAPQSTSQPSSLNSGPACDLPVPGPGGSLLLLAVAFVFALVLLLAAAFVFALALLLAAAFVSALAFLLAAAFVSARALLLAAAFGSAVAMPLPLSRSCLLAVARRSIWPVRPLAFGREGPDGLLGLVCSSCPS